MFDRQVVLRFGMEQNYRLDTRDKRRLLIAMMRAFAAENSRISFEGRLTKSDLMLMEPVAYEEVGVLKRATLRPKLNFLILPLTQQSLSRIEKAFNSKIAFGNGGIVHVQIERAGAMVFAAYDNFHRECVVAYSAVSTALLDELTVTRVLRGYRPVHQPTS
jgi:hypothetical protein